MIKEPAQLLVSLQLPYLIAMTENALLSERQRYRTASVDDVICKPIRRNEIEVAIQRAMVAIGQAMAHHGTIVHPQRYSG